MPAKNAIKEYRENGYYHIYNRGVEKRKIFLDKQDYQTFLSYLKIYLTPKDKDSARTVLAEAKNWEEKEKIIRLMALNNFTEEIDLLAYCLMPNHFHLLIKQRDFLSMQSFMRSLGTKYSHYFNRKYDRSGTLFEGRYKAVMVKSEEQLLHVSRYIHLNPEISQLRNWPYSSLNNYLGLINQTWLKSEEVLSYFSSNNLRTSYENFVSSSKNDIMLKNNLKIDD